MDIHFGIDIGGTLTKVVLIGKKRSLVALASRFQNFAHFSDQFIDDGEEIIGENLGILQSEEALPLSIGMFCFSSRDISHLIAFLEVSLTLSKVSSIPVTGGGAVKFKLDLEAAFPQIAFRKVDEINAVAVGFAFLVRRRSAGFIFDSETHEKLPIPEEEFQSPFPLLLVNVGSGVSMIKIEGPDKYDRVQGSPIGGGTVRGLGKLLFGASSFEEIMELSKHGDSSKVDLSVGELFGVSPGDDFWRKDTLASSLSKLRDSTASKADIAQSLVRMVSYNIGYVAYLVSCIHNCSRIYFSGKYVNKHVPTMEAISYAVKFYENWTPPPVAEGSIHREESPIHAPLIEQKCDVRFLHHEGYVGAIGALLSSFSELS